MTDWEQMGDRKHSFPVIASTKPWTGKAFALASDQVLYPDAAAPVTRDYVVHPGAVGIVALREENGPEILLIEQFRHPVQAFLWEIPAGLLDSAKEEPLVAAQRELAEEADLQAQEWQVLADFFTSPGCNSESLRLYLARGLSPAPVPDGFRREAEESLIRPVWWPLDKALAAVHHGRIHSPSAMVGILAAANVLFAGPHLLRAPSAPWLR